MDVLLVEDSTVVRRTLERLLRSLPGVGSVAASGGVRDAERILEQREFDFWILDFRLGDGTAMDLLARRGEPGARVAVVTNHATPGVRRRCLEAGADYFFDKSDSWEQLRAALGSGLRGAP